MKRYLLFAGYDYYPAGGWGDLVDSFENTEDAIQVAGSPTYDWAEIIDTQIMEEIWNKHKGFL